ncbi:hypothetical protein ACIPSE_24315 [Streptomyces sp. NPDC090106]|uniref:hypothetical protein n=1 Tax=Streptomyces sp. NPDC090106 TaxID=3365946 RepID=UPI0037F656BD
MVWRRTYGRTPAGLAVAGGAVLALTVACGAGGTAEGAPGNSGPGSGASADRETRYRQVLDDPHPAPADVVRAAGAPSGVARAGDGSLLLTYDVRNVEDDEGPAAFAWRIVGADGRTVAQHAEHTDAEAARVTFTGVPGGFLRVPSGESVDRVYGLDVRGHRYTVGVSDTPLRTRAGDVLLTAPEPALVHRSATRTAAPPAGLPDDAVRLALDERGTVWSLEQPLTDAPQRVVRQRAGRTLGSVAVPEPYTGGALAAGGDSAALALVRGDDTHQRVRGLLVTTDGGGTWRTLLDGGVPWKDLKSGPEALVLRTLADGRLLVGEEGGPYWITGDRAALAFHRVTTPAAFTSLTVDGTTLYGVADAPAPSYDLVEGEGLWISEDGGGTWRRSRQGG